MVDAWVWHPDVGKDVVGAVVCSGGGGICAAVKGFHAWWLWREWPDEVAKEGCDCYREYEYDSM